MLAFEQLDVFRMVAKEQSLTRAAKALFISQPALSNRIRHLEAEVGVELFDRSQRGMPLKLTRAGETLLRYAEEMAALRQQMERELREIEQVRPGDTVSIACPAEAGRKFTPSLLAAYHQRYPGVRVRILEASCRQAEALVLAGEATIGVTEGQSGDERLGIIEFARRKAALVARPELTTALDLANLRSDRARLPVALYPEGCYRRSAVERWAQEMNLELDVFLESFSSSTLRETAVQGLCFTYIPESAVANALRTGELVKIETPGLQTSWPSRFVFDRSRPAPPAALALINLAREAGWRENH